MVRDEKTEETFRADHLIEDFIDKKLDDKLTNEE
jgi:glycyl-tRNA synthetase (class II)